MNEARRAIDRRNRTMAIERDWWDRLAALADAGDVRGFWELYAKHLEATGVYSTRRAIVHRMAKLTAETLAVESAPSSSRGT